MLTGDAAISAVVCGRIKRSDRAIRTWHRWFSTPAEGENEQWFDACVGVRRKRGQELLQIPARGANVIHFHVPNAFLSASRSGTPSWAWMSGTPRSSS
jgi:hypothetical protein